MPNPFRERHLGSAEDLEDKSRPSSIQVGVNRMIVLAAPDGGHDDPLEHGRVPLI